MPLLTIFKRDRKWNDEAARKQLLQFFEAWGLMDPRRTAQRIIPGAPHETLLVMDATTGQNGLQQARMFTESAGVTGIVLTKLDGTAKGGVVVAISRELGLPVRFVGVGEKAGDLLPFDPKEFVDSLFE